jgi:hypothetical protein
VVSKPEESKERVWRTVKGKATTKYSDKALGKGYVKMNNETICVLGRKG